MRHGFPTNYAWRGEPIRDIEAWVAARGETFLIIRHTWKEERADFPNDPTMYVYDHEDDYRRYIGPTHAVDVSEEFEEPEVFWNNARLLTDGRYEVVGSRTPRAAKE